MKLANGAIIMGLDLRMRPVLISAEEFWTDYGRPEGVTVTCGLNGEHSAGSLHYYGLALDLRTHYWTAETRQEVADLLRKRLQLVDRHFQVVLHSTHIHVEFDIFAR